MATVRCSAPGEVQRSGAVRSRRSCQELSERRERWAAAELRQCGYTGGKVSHVEDVLVPLTNILSGQFRCWTCEKWKSRVLTLECDVRRRQKRERELEEEVSDLKRQLRTLSEKCGLIEMGAGATSSDGGAVLGTEKDDHDDTRSQEQNVDHERSSSDQTSRSWRDTDDTKIESYARELRDLLDTPNVV